MLFHICKCRRIRKSHEKRHRNLECQQDDNSLRSVRETSVSLLKWNGTGRGMKWKHISDEFQELLLSVFVSNVHVWQIPEIT